MNAKFYQARKVKLIFHQCAIFVISSGYEDPLVIGRKVHHWKKSVDCFLQGEVEVPFSGVRRSGFSIRIELGNTRTKIGAFTSESSDLKIKSEAIASLPVKLKMRPVIPLIFARHSPLGTLRVFADT